MVVAWVGSAITFQLPEPTGTGPFVYGVVDPPTAGQGIVTIGPTGLAELVPGPDWAGSVTFAYVVTDADGLLSEPALARMEVAAPAPPPSGPADVPLPATRHGGGEPATRGPAASQALARTGSQPAGLIGLAVGALLVGAGLRYVSRRTARLR